MKDVIPSAVRPVLDWWLPQVRRCLRGKLHAVVLHGSVVLDDFCPGWSDCDDCVIVGEPVSEAEGTAIGAIHDRMRGLFIRERNAGWMSGQAVEGYYVPYQLVADGQCRMACYTAGGTTRRWAIEHPISPFDRYMLAHVGVPIAGTPVCFTPPRRNDLVSQAHHDITDLRNHDAAKQSSIWLCGMFHWLARSLVFWRDGAMLSKSAALEQMIAAGSDHAEAFSLALEIRRRGSASAARHQKALLQHFRKHALACADELESVIRERTPNNAVGATRQ